MLIHNSCIDQLSTPNNKLYWRYHLVNAPISPVLRQPFKRAPEGLHWALPPCVYPLSTWHHHTLWDSQVFSLRLRLHTGPILEEVDSEQDSLWPQSNIVSGAGYNVPACLASYPSSSPEKQGETLGDLITFPAKYYVWFYVPLCWLSLHFSREEPGYKASTAYCQHSPCSFLSVSIHAFFLVAYSSSSNSASANQHGDCLSFIHSTLYTLGSYIHTDGARWVQRANAVLSEECNLFVGCYP